MKSMVHLVCVIHCPHATIKITPPQKKRERKRKQRNPNTHKKIREKAPPCNALCTFFFLSLHQATLQRVVLWSIPKR